jgi:hypothetical protein
MDGKLIAEGHSVGAWGILDAIADILPNKVSCKYISNEAAELGFEKDLSDLLDRVTKF